jgi:hypothetical protein
VESKLGRRASNETRVDKERSPEGCPLSKSGISLVVVGIGVYLDTCEWSWEFKDDSSSSATIAESMGLSSMSRLLMTLSYRLSFMMLRLNEIFAWLTEK